MIPDWKRLLTFFSTWVALLVPLWAAMPDDLKMMIPDWLQPVAPFLWAAAWGAARVKAQK